jgi:hypothetical protein
LFSALAMADSSTFLTWPAIRRLEKASSARAASAVLPRIVWHSRLSFCGLVRMARTMAMASLSARLRGCLGLLMA